MRKQSEATYIHERIPSLPEVTVGNDTDCFPQLSLDSRRNGNHQADQFTLDGSHLVGCKFVVAIFVGPIPFDKVFET